MSQNTFIECSNISLAFDQCQVLSDISFRIELGEIIAVVGRNGAGKTTLFSILQGLLEPQAGILHYCVNGQKLTGDAFKRKMAIQLQKSSHFKQLKVKEVLTLYAKIANKKLEREKIYRCVEMADTEDKEIRMLSGGQLQKLNIALAVLKDTEFTFYDEPTVGLDVSTRGRFVDYLRQTRTSDRTTLIITHYLDEIESICTKVLILNAGRVVDFTSPEELRRKYLKSKTVRIFADISRIDTVLQAIQHLEYFHWFSDGALYVTTDHADSVVTAIYQDPLISSAIYDVAIRSSNLQDVVVRITG